MLFGNDRLFEQARKAKRRGSCLSGSLEALQRWTSERYSVNVLHIALERIQEGPSKGRPRLDLIVETPTDLNALRWGRFTLKREVVENLQRKFSELESLPRDSILPLITIEDFASEAVGRAVGQFLNVDCPAVLREFEKLAIWDISGFSAFVVVFYPTDRDVRANQENGESSRVEARCRELISRYDEFSYMGPALPVVRFDSKQNVDENYSGNMFYYWK